LPPKPASTRPQRNSAQPGGNLQPGERLDVLAFGTHPDDLEIACGGTLRLLSSRGYRVGAVDLTRGELGTRGTAASRAREAANASRVMGLALRENLKMPDGGIEISQKNLRAVIRVIRRHRPRLVLAPYWEERHPDHVHASRLVSEAAFYSGLPKIETGEPSFRPFRILYYVSRIEFTPSFVVDITSAFDAKVEAIRCYRTQFHHGRAETGPGEQETLLSTPLALEVFETISRYYGAMIGTRHGEPFLMRETLEVDDLVEFFRGFPDDRQAHLFSRQ
jgi:bacillithiol biosynthesis deacetylase BshB1